MRLISNRLPIESGKTSRTYGEAVNMLLCQQDPMLCLGLFRYPEAGLSS